MIKTTTAKGHTALWLINKKDNWEDIINERGIKPSLVERTGSALKIINEGEKIVHVIQKEILKIKIYKWEGGKEKLVNQYFLDWDEEPGEERRYVEAVVRRAVSGKDNLRKEEGSSDFWKRILGGENV